MKPDYKIKSLREVIKIVEKESQITTIIFDLGDTLFSTFNPDELEFERDQKQLALIKSKYPELNIEIGHYIKEEKFLLEKMDRIKRATFKEERFEDFADKLLQKIIRKRDKALLKEFCEIQYEYMLKKTDMKPAVIPTLLQLKRKNYKLGVITNTWHSRRQINKKLDKLKIKNFFSSIIISADFGTFKPHPSIFKKSLKELRSKPEEAIFVGNDLEADIYGANNVGIKTVLIRM